jgi:hypothetical protein
VLAGGADPQAHVAALAAITQRAPGRDPGAER